MKDKTILACTAIAAIVFLESIWVMAGHNSISMTLAIGAILTIAGFKVGFDVGFKRCMDNISRRE